MLFRSRIINYTVTGDTRFDRVAAIAQNAREISIIEKFKNGGMLLVAGSTWKPDEDLIATLINNHAEFKLIVAPHEVTPANLSRVDTLFSNAIRFSKLKEEKAGNYRVLVIDSVGMLSSLYRYGDLAYIGGGFGVGIHNILEAATFGLPVIFGPNFEKFREAVDLLSLGGAFSVKDYDMLENTISGLLSDSASMQAASVTCKNYVVQKVGSTQIILKKVFNI